jgi:nitrogen fixation NifU-like protein
MMTEELIGKSKKEGAKIIENVIHALRNEKNPDVLDEYGDLAALKGVIKFPVRVKCATLAWHAMQDLLYQGKMNQITKNEIIK